VFFLFLMISVHTWIFMWHICSGQVCDLFIFHNRVRKLSSLHIINVVRHIHSQNISFFLRKCRNGQVFMCITRAKWSFNVFKTEKCWVTDRWMCNPTFLQINSGYIIMIICDINITCIYVKCLGTLFFVLRRLRGRIEKFPEFSRIEVNRASC
jgi:hypothetical protein